MDHFSFAHTELAYPEAGHGVGVVVPYVPAISTATTSAGEVVDLGPTLPNEEARADAWPKLLAFLASQ